MYNLYLGAKYFFIEKNSIKGYLVGEVWKPITSGSIKVDGEENETVKKFFDGLSLWGFNFGFGTEYFFSENFSLGGEFGIRFLLVSSETEDKSVYSYTGYGYTATETSTSKVNADIGLSLTYSLLTLNYYF